MLKKEQTHEKLLLKIARDYYLEHNYPLEDLPEKITTQMYSQFDNEGDKDLCFKMLPYLQFERDNMFVIEIFKYKNRDDFKDILYDAIVNNSDILQKFSYEKYALYRAAKDLLSQDKLEKLEVFSSFKQNKTKEENIDTISFDFDKLSLFENMSMDILLSNGRLRFSEFIDFIKSSRDIKKEIGISLMMEYQTQEPNIIKLVFVNPEDKDLVRRFIEHMPLILSEILPLIVEPQSSIHPFKLYEDIAIKHIQAMKLDYSLPAKSDIKAKKI